MAPLQAVLYMGGATFVTHVRDATHVFNLSKCPGATAAPHHRCYLTTFVRELLLQVLLALVLALFLFGKGSPI